MTEGEIFSNSEGSNSEPTERFAIGEIMAEAWGLTKGSKSLLLPVYSLVVVASVVVIVGLHWAGGVSFSDSDDRFGNNLISAINSLIVGPLFAGLLLYSIKRARHDPAQGWSDVFAPYSRMFSLYGLQILLIVLIIIGTILLILPGLYLVFAYGMAVPLWVDQRLGIWESLETSRKTVSKVWFRYFGLISATTLLSFLGGLLTLGIGLIWILPWAFLVHGVAYRRLFGSTTTRP